jgi:DHA1 family multidrug resistance protein-like MFS transporter
MLACLSSTYASATMTGTEPFLAEHFHISQEVAILATSSLFLLGYTFGPLVWSPLSEYAGRKLPYALSMFGFYLFAAGAATAQDYQTLVLCRFFQASMGSAPMATTAAAYADMFSIYHLGAAATLFAVTVFIGPLLAPFISGFTLENSNLGWRWCEWWSFFFGLLALICVVFLAEESYAPVLLSRKAASLRRETGNWAIHAKSDEASLTIRDLLEKIVIRPARMMIQEPILLALSIYTAFAYALLYTFLVSYGIVFVEGYGMGLGVGGLPFLGLVVGMVVAMIVNLNQQRYYSRWIRENSGKMIPEWRMPLCITGAVAFAVGLFWFGWTAAYPKSVHWMAPTASGIVTGYGILMIFMSCFTYMVDIYLSK